MHENLPDLTKVTEQLYMTNSYLYTAIQIIVSKIQSKLKTVLVLVVKSLGRSLFVAPDRQVITLYEQDGE